MTDIGDVPNLRDLVPVILQHPAQDVAQNERSKIADVDVVVDGGSTAVDPGASRLDRHELLELVAKRIRQVHREGAHQGDPPGGDGPFYQPKIA
jgi:hypothetical protein